MPRSVFVAIVMSAAALFAAQPLYAQSKQQTRSSVTDQQLDKEAAAMKSLHDLRSTYSEKVQAAEPGKRDAIISEANKAMEKAITDQGLSVDEYRSIINIAQNDESVRDRLVKRLGIEPQQ